MTDIQVTWRYDRGAPYVSSPVVVGDYLFAVRNRCVATSLHTKTGKVAWHNRSPVKGDYYSSIVATGGKIYTSSKEGKVCVLEVSPTCKLVKVNDMGQRCMATSSISKGQIFIRTDQILYSIGQPRK